MGEPARATRRITAADVGRAAGVSATTVSYVLNNTPHQQIPEQTRERVLAAARELDYAPSAAARALVRGASDVVLFLVPPSLAIDRWFGSLLERLSQVMAKDGFIVAAHPWQPDESTGHVWRALSPVAVAGISIDRADVKAMLASGVREVLTLVGGQSSFGRFLTQLQDDVALQQLQALQDAGHTRIGYAVPRGRRPEYSAFRLACAQRAAASLGMPAPPVRAIDETDPHEAGRTLREWTAGEAGVTAVAALDDRTAGAVLAGMRLLDMCAPADLAVIGEGDDPMSAFLDPPLTTVLNDPIGIADAIAAHLIRRIHGKPAARHQPEGLTRVVRRATV